MRQEGGIQIIVGMGTCGIAAGAREVMSAILDEIAKRKLQDVTVRQTGCIGMCEKEVLVDVVRPGEPRITYGDVTPATVAKNYRRTCGQRPHRGRVCCRKNRRLIRREREG